MNLLTDPWLQARYRDGQLAWIHPAQIADPGIVALEACRPDFLGALYQFLIGLLQTVSPVGSTVAWRQRYRTPPTEAELAAWFAPLHAMFEVAGPGPRFFQDSQLPGSDAGDNPIAALFMDSPGENALRNNSDHFVKRGRMETLCPTCATLALLTLQTNAPAGGVGYRTSLRGGGPLTTLVRAEPRASLWHDLWLNVLERSAFEALNGQATPGALVRRFPWMGPLEAIQPGEATAPAQVHPDHVYWAMPRRIWLQWEETPADEPPATCDACGAATGLRVRHFLARNYGLNYKGAWQHPLSPYYLAKEEWLPLHPQPGGIGYRHWLPWVLGLRANRGEQRPAEVVRAALTGRSKELPQGLGLWAFGYDMDNMKARCWYEATLPLYHLEQCSNEAQQQIKATVGQWLDAATQVVGLLRNGVKNAWFARDARGDFSAVDAVFWQRTEGGFYRQLQTLLQAAQEAGEQQETEAASAAPGMAEERWHRTLATLGEAWLQLIQREALRVFDADLVGIGPVESENPGRIARAYQQLKAQLFHPRLRDALGLPRQDPARKPGKGRNPSAAPTPPDSISV